MKTKRSIDLTSVSVMCHALLLGLAAAPLFIQQQANAQDGESSCCIPHATPGCDNADCQAAVCAEDPFCCDKSWDSLCVEGAQALCSDLCPAPSVVPVTSVGGGGHGDPLKPLGLWAFDVLSDSQRNEPANCENTVFTPFGEVLIPHGWEPSPDGFVIPQIVPFDGQPGTSVGGGVVRFADPDFGGFLPGHISLLESPVIPAADLKLEPGRWVEVAFSAHTAKPHPDIHLIVGVRINTLDGWSPWFDQIITPEAGTQHYRASFIDLDYAIADDVQIRLGAANQNKVEPVPENDGPLVDDAEAETVEEAAREWKFVPDISQGDEAICQATAFANCLSWWANQEDGYPELAEGDTQQEKNEHIQDELKKRCHDQNLGDGGVTKYLREKKVLRGQPQTGDRPQLRHIARRDANATWEFAKEKAEANADVLLRLQWYNKDGELVDPDAAHYVTVSRIVDRDEDCIYVSNPWFESHHEVDDENKDEAYDKLDVTKNKDGTIRVDNDTLENRAAGIEGAEYLCVDSINVIEPVEDSESGYDPHPAITAVIDTNTQTGSTDVYNYAVANFFFDEPQGYWALMLPVPILSVEVPDGWTAEPLPALYPKGSGCGAKLGLIGVAGYAFSTDTNAIPPGDSQDGFLIEVAAGFDFDPTGLAAVAYMDTGTGIGEYFLGPGPEPRPGDIDLDGTVGTADLLQLLAAWGDCDDPDDCPEDIDGNGSVGTEDLLELLANWG